MSRKEPVLHREVDGPGGGRGGSAPRRRRAGRLVLLALGAAVAALAAGVWYFRDLPRRRVERALEEKLGASVRVGSLEILGARRFRLRDLEVTRMTGQPRLELVRARAVEATGSVMSMMDGRFEALRLSDIEARLVAPPAPSSAEAGGAVQFSSGTLDVERCVIVIAAGGGDARLTAEASLRNVGSAAGGPIGAAAPSDRPLGATASSGGQRRQVSTRLAAALIRQTPVSAAGGKDGGVRRSGPGADPGEKNGSLAGEVRLRAERLPLGPVLAFLSSSERSDGAIGGAVEALEARASILQGGARVEIVAKGRSLGLRNGDRALALPDPALEVSVVRNGAAGPIRIEARPSLSLVESASLSAEIDPGTLDLIAADATLRGVKLDPLVGLFGAALGEVRTVGAAADLEVKGSERNAFDFRLGVRAPRVELGDARAGNGRSRESGGGSRAGGTGRAGPGGGGKKEGRGSEAGGREREGPESGGGAAIRVAAEGVSMEAAGTLRLDRASPSVSARVAIDVPRGSGSIAGTALPAGLFPAHLTLDGGVRLGNDVQIDGKADLATASAGALAVSGTARVSNEESASTPTSVGRAAARGAAWIASPIVASLARMSLAAVNSMALGDGPARMSAVRVSSTALAEGPATGATLELEWRWKEADLPALTEVAQSMGYALPSGLFLRGTIGAEGTLRGNVSSPAVTGTVSARDLEASIESTEAGPSNQTRETIARSGRPARETAWALRRGSAAARFNWTWAGASIDVPSVEIGGEIAADPLAPFMVRLTASGRVDPGGRETTFDDVRLEAPGLVSARARGRADLAKLLTAVQGGAEHDASEDLQGAEGPRGAGGPTVRPEEPSSAANRREPVRSKAGGGGKDSTAEEVPALSATVRVEGIDLSRWRSFLGPLIGDPAPGYEVKGDASANLEGALLGNGRWTTTGTATLAKSGFASEDGGQVLEGLDATWDVKLAGGGGADPIALEARGRISGFQLLWGSLFVDGTPLTSTLDVSARVERSNATRDPANDTFAGRADSDRIAANRSAADRDHAELAATPASASTWGGHAVWSFPEGPTFDVSLDGAPGAPLAYDLKVEVVDLGTTVARYLRAPLGDSIPMFSRIEAAGVLHAEAKGTLARESRSLRGRVRLEKTTLTGTQGFAEVQGLDLDLPIDLTWKSAAAPPAGADRRSPSAVAERPSAVQTRAGASESDGRTPSTPPASEQELSAARNGVEARPVDAALSGEELRGRASFSSLVVGGLHVGALTTGLRARADSLALDEALRIPLFGGTVALERLELVELFGASRRLETGITLSSLDVGEASRAFELLPLSGRMDGRFSRVRLSMDRLEVEGGGEVSLFGGTLKVSGISGEEILSRYPKLVFSADFEEIDLQQVTRTLDFGEMTGILRGHVHDCELFRGVPVRFEGMIETVERRGVSRTINVKAINNIAILGTGGGVSVLDKGIHKFFDEYTYGKLGIAMSLKNDAFLLRGLVHEGGREFFLRGRLPFPIHVVNVQPGTTVSFRTMVERLKSLDFGAATTSR